MRASSITPDALNYKLTRTGLIEKDTNGAERVRSLLSQNDELKKISEQERIDRVMLGEGTLDLPHVIGLLKKIGYEGPVSLELFNETLWKTDPALVLRDGFERLHALLAT